MIENHNISLMCRLLIHLIAKLLTMPLDFKVVNMILIVLNLYNLVKDHPNFYIKESGVRKIKDIFYINGL